MSVYVTGVVVVVLLLLLLLDLLLLDLPLPTQKKINEDTATAILFQKF